MYSKLFHFFDHAIKSSFLLLFFLTPLLLTPWNFELFEFNKMIFVYALTFLVFFFWGAKMLFAQKIIFRPTPFVIPLGLFLFSQILSTITSIDTHTSLWGYYSRFHGGLLSTVSFIFLYFAFVSNIRKNDLKRIFFFLFSSAAIVSTYGILEHFGIDAKYWVQDVQNRVFSTLGQPNWLAAYLAAVIPLTWALSINNKSKKTKFIYYTLGFIFTLCLLYTKSRSGILAFGISFAVFAVIIRKRLLVTGALLLGLIAIIGTPWTPGLTKIFSKNNNPAPATGVPVGLNISESSDIRKIVWKGAIDIWKNYPVLGSGVETFAYSYYKFRPREHNDVSEWDFLYNKAHNEYLNMAANTGTVGIASYLILIGWFVVWCWRNLKKDPLIVALLSGFVSILATNFFGFSVVIVGLFFFLFPGIAVVLAEKDDKEIKPKTLPDTYLIFLALLLGLTIYSLYYLGAYWYADTLYAKGEKSNNDSEFAVAFESLRTAIRIHPEEPVYHNEISITSANLAGIAWDKKDATPAAQLTIAAIRESDKAVTKSPFNVTFWKDRTKVYYALTELDKNYYYQALEAILKAKELAPTDAKVVYNLGLLYAQIGKEDQAIKSIEEAITLKPNYEAARYALALFYHDKKEDEKAKEQLKYILEKINPGNKTAKDTLEKWQNP